MDGALRFQLWLPNQDTRQLERERSRVEDPTALRSLLWYEEHLRWKMEIAETAICLVNSTETPGGIWTPGAALRGKLISRLQENAGVTFEVE